VGLVTVKDVLKYIACKDAEGANRATATGSTEDEYDILADTNSRRRGLTLLELGRRRGSDW